MAAGFVGFEITWRADVFTGAPQASSAANFGTLGMNFRARKPHTQQEWLAAVSDSSDTSFCPVTPAQTEI